MIRRLIAATLCLALAAPGLALAQPASDTQTAVALARDAKEKYDQGDWQGALELFEAAEAKAHSPVLLLYAARCNRNLGRLLRARELLTQVTSEALGPTPPSPFVTAQKDAAADLQALEARIPKLVIDRSAAPASWVVALDGDTVETNEVEVDPGEHVVTAAGGAFEKKVTALEGATVTVIVTPPSSPRPAPPPPPPAPVVPAPSDDALLLAPGLSLLGLGVIGLAVGVGLRVTALEKVSDVKDRCIGGSCLAADEAEIDDAVTLETVSTVLFAVGGAAAATGVVLLIVLPGGGDDVSLDVRPGYLGLRGSF